MSKQSFRSFPEAQQHVDELMARRTAGDNTYDQFRIVADDPRDESRVHVEGRRHDDHTVRERV